MSNELITTMIGNTTADAELKFLPSGKAVASFTLVQTPREKRNDQWVDGEPIFVRCTAWEDYAEHIGQTVTKGMRLIVHGRVKAKSWEKDGVKRTGWEMTIDGCGPDLRYATATVQKAERRMPDGSAPRQPGQPSPEDPWANTTVGGGQQPAFDSEPPF